MKKITLSLLLTLCSFYGYTQAITASTTNYTVPQLVTDVLFGSGVGGGACAGTISNITWTSCGNNGIGSFTNTNPNFPLQSGVVLVSGNVSATPGPNGNIQSNGNCGGDQELFDYIDGLGIDPGLIDYNDAAILEFDFVPLTNTMSFDFLFASEEYGTFQCTFSDAFAFFLTNTTAGTPTTNLALIPSTTIPVSVITIRNTLYNGGCPSANPLFFDKYYLLPEGLNPNIAPINFNGHTVKMTASSSVVPNDTYHIKLVVADRNDSALDSAVFLGGGSFNIGQANISGANGTGFEALTDFTVANGAALCFQSCREVRAGTAPIPGVTYQWTLGGVPIPGATNFNYNICAPGTYGIIITFPSGCIQEDTMEVEFLPAMPVSDPVDLYSGSTLFDLTLNSPTILNGQSATDYIINYHLTLQDAIDVANIIPNPASFIGYDGQEIFVSIQDDASGTDCRETRSFILHIVEPGAVTPPDLVLCDDVSNDGIEIFNLVQQTPIILGSNIATDYVITYHVSQFDADNDLNPIANPVAYPNITNPQIIYVRMEEVGNSTAFDSVFFQLIVNQYPIAGSDGAITVCETSTTVINLASLITGEQTGGVWVRDNGTGGTFDAVAGTFTPALGATSSTFTYTVTGVAPCTFDASSVNVTINSQPNAGSNGLTTVCETDSTVIDLFSLITGEQTGGVWVRSSGTGGSFSAVAGTFTPGIGATNSTFTYTINGVAPCSNSSSVATVNINPQPSAGFAGSTTVCETSTAVINLASLITGEQAGGVWVRSSGTGGAFSAAAGTFTPAVGATNSTFTYTLTATAPCLDSSSVATVNINPQPVAGTDGATTICETSTATIDLYSLITGEQTGGTWVRNSGSGGAFDGVLGTFTPAVGATTSTFIYTLTGVAPCINDSSTATITINPQPNAGTDGSTVVCEGSTAVINLFSLITGEQAGGVWTRTSGTGGTFNSAAGTFTPSTGVTTSAFAYTLTATAPCLDDSSTVTISVNPLSTATITASSPSVCLNYPSPTVTLSGFTGTSPYTFVYTVNGGAPIVSLPSSPTYNINVPTNAVGPITYCLVSVTDANGCGQNINQCVTVTVLTAPIINTPIPYELCDDESNDGVACFDLEGVVHPQVTSNATLEVTFHETLTDAQTGNYDQASPYCNINNLNNQIIYIRVFDPNAPECYAITTVQLIVHPKPTAVEPTDLHECDNGDAQLGFTVFNLTDKASEILGSISPLTHTISYYESLPDAEFPINAIGNPTSYTNIVANTQTIWVRVETTATGCFDIVELQLVVDPLPLVNQPACAAYTLCETTAPVGYEQFDLQTRVDCILQNQLGMSVTFYRSLTDANNNNNPITNLLYVNQQQYVQTLGIRVTDSTTGCYVVSTMDIRVEPLPIPVAPLTPYAVCDTDQNGQFEFDLNTLSAGILGANPTNNTISYHETQPDANSGNYPIDLTQLYQNLVPYLQTIWVRVENPLTGCYGVIPIQLRVNESPRMPDLDDLVYCDEDSNNQNATTTVNLAQQTPIILAAQTIPPTSNYTVTYYTSLANAQTQTSPIVNTTTYTGTNQTIWVVIKNNTTGCFEIGEFNLIVNIPLALTPPPALSVCDDDASPNDLHTTFDLTVRNDAITGALPGYTVTYYPSYANALAGINQITNPTAYINGAPAVQTLGVKVTSPDGCRSYTTMDIRVLPVPTPNTTNIPILAPQCEDALNSGQQFFDLTVNQTYILNGDPNVTPHYYHSLADATAVPPVNEILNPSFAYIGNPLSNPPRPVNEIQYIYIAVTSNIFTEYTGQNCAVIVQQPFIINPLPIANAIGEQQICEEDAAGNDGYEVFDLPSYNNLILAGNDTTPVSTYVVNFYTDAGLTNQIANPSAYTNITNPQTIYVSVTTTNTYVDPVTGITHTTSCTTLTNFDIRVNPKPTITQPAAPLATCDVNDGLNDGYQIYDLTSLETEILNGQDPTQFSVTFYESEYNPDATPPLTPTAIALPATHPVYTHTYWAAVTNNATGCFKTTSFNIVVEQTPEPFITNDIALNVICVDYTNQQVVRPLTLEVENQTDYLNDPTTPAPTYTYEWFEDGVALANSNSPTYTITEPLDDTISSIFTVVMTSQSALGCSTESQDYLVIQSGQATPISGTIGYTVTNAFSDNQIITVTTEGYGTYQYSLDDGPRQDSPVFENVSLGEHFITVWDTEGGLENSCNPLILVNVQTIDYPLYFTPNGDGIHDSWNIVGLSGQPGARIYIFDRHGKLIKQLSSQSEGWNGTYNGQQMPATDYWFTVDYSEQNAEKQFRAHFSLKR